MSHPTIQLDNTTASPIVLVQLGIQLPASSSVLATDSVLVSTVVNDPELNTFVDSGDITLTVDAVALTSEQSIAYIGYDRPKDNVTAVVPPTVNDDADAGYSVNSVWIDVQAAVSHLCVDNTNNAALWVQTGGGSSSFGSPVSVGTTNQDGSSGLHTQSDHVHAHGDQPGGSLHAVVTTSVDGFMSAADKTKLDSLVGTNGGTEFTSVTVSTTSGTFQDAFTGQNLTVPATGAYMIIFEGNIAATNGNTVNEIGIGTDTGGGTLVVVDSQRLMQGNGGAEISTFCHTFVNLTSGDTVTGLFRRSSGSGTVSMDNRRLTLLQLSITP